MSKNKEETIACDVCMNEIPASGAKSDEASDYVAHFCGVECYDKWKAQDTDDSDDKKSDDG